MVGTSPTMTEERFSDLPIAEGALLERPFLPPCPVGLTRSFV